MTDIFQSPGDRLRFEILLKSLKEGSTNLAVLSEHDKVLDFYGDLFEERLLAQGDGQVEFCSSTNSERLVQKFNEILSELTLNQALEKDKKHAPRRYLVFRDSILMQDFELQLLARLVNGFPASNITVILLINSSGNYRNKLQAFGKSLVEWEVETQAGEPKSNLGDDWVRSDPEPSLEPPVLRDEVTPVAQLLNIPTKTSWRVPGFGKRQEPVFTPDPLPPPPTSPGVSASTPSFANTLAAATPVAAVAAPVSVAASPLSAPELSREPALHEMGAASEASPTDVDMFKRPARSISWGWVFILFLLSAGVFAVMYQDLVRSEVEQFKKYLLRGTPAVAAPAEAAASAATLQAASEAAASAAQEVASSAASAASAAQAMPASAALDPKESLVSASSPVPVKALAPATEALASAAVVAAPASASKPETKAPAEPVDKNTAKPNAKEADTKSDEAWVNQMPANGYVVQLAAFDTEEETQAFKRAQTLYAKARVLRVYKKDSKKRYFILVAGPWATKAEADAFMQSSPVLAKGWLRSAKSLKAQFTKP